ncbi:XTP/dITP diphosphatase [Methanobacterium formicicum]|jgi:XTP/dITP diphosphohydrolase|uniref:dITP/XTP pyrophosphatase n=1 Tax=Methanobacterium formicicum TaxID=2162 RepID=A0A0S4FSM9_METFO|nr:XTP/dITP diphosphatase [Methanobacterium formicicum]CEL26044.1 Non-canonical purine NTP pyrophosphatase [Methanobacterium formicicum]
MGKSEDPLYITFITGNQHKVKEAQGIFHQFNIKVEHVDLGYPEIQGELIDVARFGAVDAARRLGRPVIVEDAGLFIKALNWFPGTYSSYVQDTLGNQGILKLMNNVKDRYAEFRSVIGFATPTTEPETFLGVVGGQIAHQEKGDHGFAYDPLFVPEGYSQTFGELTRKEKNEFSHRRRSLENFAQWYKDFINGE